MAAKVLANLPGGLRDPLVATYREIASNYIEGRWEPSELNAGKLCEIVYTIADGALCGTFAATPSKPADMVASCRALEQRPPNASLIGDRSLRILIPRFLLPLYEIRNNRNVGHVGGDVNPNYLDATTTYSMSSWLVAEIIRIFHGVSTIEAQQTVNALVERKNPLIWEVDGVKRVLDPKMSKSDQTLLILYSEAGSINEKQLCSWIEYSTLGMYRTRVLISLHKDRLVEYDLQSGSVRISPAGVKEVESRLLPKGTV